MAITPSVSILETTSKRAPASVFVDLTGTTSTATSYPFHELWYEVYYGDPSSGNFSANSLQRSKNHRFGAFTAHLYETAGTYTITIIIKEVAADGTVTDEYRTTQDVTVYDPTGASGWAVGDRVVYAADNNFTGAPAGTQKYYDNDTYDWDSVAADLNAGKMVYLKGGNTFVIDTGLVTGNLDNNTGPAYITTWGTGRAILDAEGGAQTVFNFSNGDVSDVRIENLELDGGGGSLPFLSINTLVGCTDMPTQITVHNCYIHDLASHGFRLGFDDGDFGGGVTPNNQFLIHENETYDTNYGILCRLYKSAILGNKFREQTLKAEGEHCARLQWLSKSEVADNYAEDAKTGKHCFTLRGNELTWYLGDICPTNTQYVILSGNETSPSQTQAIPFDVSPSNPDYKVLINDILVEGNIIKHHPSGTAKLSHYIGIRITVRNNVFIGPTGSTGVGAVTMDSEAQEQSGYGNEPDHLWVYNNTYYAAGDAANFPFFSTAFGAYIDNVEMRNNVHCVPNISGAYDFDSGEGDVSNYIDANNDKNDTIANLKFHGNDPTEAEHCDIHAESSLVGQGSNRLGAFYDFFYRKRHYGGTIDQGAFEYRRTRLLAF